MAWELPLGVVLGVVAVGVPAVVWLTHLTGGSEAEPLSVSAVEALIVAEAGDAELVRVDLTADAAAALAQTTDGRQWVAWVMEGMHAVREVPPGGLVAAPEGVAVDVSDPGWPRRVVPLPAESRAHWVDPPARGANDGAA